MKITMENNVLKNFITNQPVWFAIAISVFDLLLGFAIFMVGSLIGLPEELLEVVILLTITALPLVIIGWLGWWQEAGFASTIQNAGALAVPLIVHLLTLIWFGIIDMEGRQIATLIVAYFLTALGEEALSRGLLFRALLPRGKWQAVLIPSILFGLGHVTKLIQGMPLSDNMLQMVNSALTGFLLASVRLRVNNIWPLIILHMLGDLFSSLTGIFGVPGALGLAGIPMTRWLIRWALLIIPGIYFVTRTPTAVTIDSQVVE